MMLDTKMTKSKTKEQTKKTSRLQADEINDDNGWRSLASRVYQD